jgi:hypothetical protein
MNRYERRPISVGEAEVEYLDGEVRILRPGAFVRCAVTGAPIRLEDLRYWNVDLQEPYASPEAKLKRLGLELKARTDVSGTSGSEDPEPLTDPSASSS